MKKPNKDCNASLLDDVVHSTNELPQTVRSAVNFFSKFIADTIAEGAFETVIVPYFGKFKPKEKEIQWKAHNKGVERGGPITQQDANITNNNGEL